MISMQQQDALVASGLATCSVNGWLSTYKYHRKVMYKNLWDRHLLECRGHTYDNRTGAPVTVPFPKFFSYLEGDTFKAVSLSAMVNVYRKVNGFMAAVTLYEGEVVVSTTGSTRSDYAVQAKSAILASGFHPTEGATSLFELCLKEDSITHPIAEQQEVTKLADRFHNTGYIDFENSLGWMRLADVLDMAKSSRDEGFMLVTESGEVCKLKSDYYVGKKRLMRSPQFPNALPGDWADPTTKLGSIATLIRQEQAQFMLLPAKERRLSIEKLEKLNG